jgi:hypothetical protein
MQEFVDSVVNNAKEVIKSGREIYPVVFGEKNNKIAPIICVDRNSIISAIEQLRRAEVSWIVIVMCVEVKKDFSGEMFSKNCLLAVGFDRKNKKYIKCYNIIKLEDSIEFDEIKADDVFGKFIPEPW